MIKELLKEIWRRNVWNNRHQIRKEETKKH